MLVLLGAVGAILGRPLVGLVVAVLVAGAWGAWVWWGGPGAARRALGGTPADPVAAARLHNVVEGLCTAAGVTKPALLVLDDPAPNAAAFGRSAREATLVVSSGLLEQLGRVELEGVVARQLGLVKSHDIHPATVAVALLTVLGPIRPLAERIRRVATARNAVSADADGVTITRYPPALASAYEKLRVGGPTARPASPATAHLWLADPTGDTTADPRPPLEERIEALREL